MRRRPEALSVQPGQPIKDDMDGGSERRSSTSRPPRLVRLLREVTAVADQADRVSDAGWRALRAVSEAAGWPVGHLWLPAADDPESFRSSGLWHTGGGPDLGALRAVSERLRFTAGIGIVGLAIQRGAPVWSSDVQRDPRFVRAEAATRSGIESAFAFPVLAGAGPAAVLEFFAPTRMAPEPELLDVLADVGAQLARVADRVAAGGDLANGVERLERVIESSVEAFVATDGAGVITSWNAAAERVFGLTRAEAVGRSLTDTIVPPRLRAAHDAGMSRFLRAGERAVLDHRTEIIAWHPGGGYEFPAELASWVVRDASQPAGWTFHAFIHDISQRRRGEEALQIAYERERRSVAHLKELDEAKSEFVATVSHELRTPLTNVIGHLELLAAGELGDLTGAQQRTVAVIARNSDRLRALIEDLLTVSRVQAGAFDLSFAPTDLPALLAAARQVVAARAAQKGHQLDVRIEPGLAVLLADAPQLQRAMVNLLVNAINFTPAGGQVLLAARPVPGAVEIEVRDTGVGIDAQEIPRLFTRFYRGAFAVRESVQGAGLGLTITKTIVEGHGGSIAVASAPGSGSTFTVCLPR